MDNLTYSIYYTPNAKNTDFDDVSYICSDKKIHIRFRDYNSEDIIVGFEKKLTYLLTYLLNYSYLPNVFGKYNERELMETFGRTNDVLDIINTIRRHLPLEELKGFKLRTNYKKSECKPFGDISTDVFPVEWVDKMAIKGDLQTFLSKLKISLDDYLFNDNYMIIIRENKTINFNKKFINKANKKTNRQNLSNLDLVELW